MGCSVPCGIPAGISILVDVVRVDIVLSHLLSKALEGMRWDSIKWSCPQNIVLHLLDELKLNQDSFLDLLDDTIWLNILLKIVEDNII